MTFEDILNDKKDGVVLSFVDNTTSSISFDADDMGKYVSWLPKSFQKMIRNIILSIGGKYNKVVVGVDIVKKLIEMYGHEGINNVSKRVVVNNKVIEKGYINVWYTYRFKLINLACINLNTIIQDDRDNKLNLIYG